MKRILTLALPLAAAIAIALPASAGASQVFCRQGWHRVHRHGTYVCVRNRH